MKEEIAIDHELAVKNSGLRQSGVLVVNTSFPELDYFAAALSSRNLLSNYVRPYVNKRRFLENLFPKFPVLGQYYANTLGRRRVPEGLDTSKIREAAIASDFLMAFCQRAGRSSEGMRALADRLVLNRAQRIADAGAKWFNKESVVLSSWSCAGPAFTLARRVNAKTLLNYSLAHPRFTRKKLQQEAELVPGFSQTLQNDLKPGWFEDKLNEEISLATQILVGSTFVKQSFEQEGIDPSRLTILPYGTDVSAFSPKACNAKPSTDFRVLFVGQLSQRKGISYLLTACQMLRGAGMSLTLAGRPLMALDLYGRPGIDFVHIDHLPRSKMPEVYRSADIFVLPTLVEGMPIVVIEAMASGVPVIVTDNGPGDIVRDGVDGFVVPERDAESLAEKLEILRVNRELRETMGRNARERALSYSWSTYQHRALEVVGGLIAGNEV